MNKTARDTVIVEPLELLHVAGSAERQQKMHSGMGVTRGGDCQPARACSSHSPDAGTGQHRGGLKEADEAAAAPHRTFMPSSWPSWSAALAASRLSSTINGKLANA